MLASLCSVAHSPSPIRSRKAPWGARRLPRTAEARRGPLLGIFPPHATIADSAGRKTPSGLTAAAQAVMRCLWVQPCIHTWPWLVANGALDGVAGGKHGWLAAEDSRHKGEPLQHGCAAGKIILYHMVAHAVDGHDLGPTQLHVAGVHLAPQQLVQRRVARQDDRLVRALDAPARRCPHAVCRQPSPTHRNTIQCACMNNKTLGIGSGQAVSRA